MRNEGRTLPTLEERLALAARSQASSPEAAAKRKAGTAVTGLHQLHRRRRAYPGA